MKQLRADELERGMALVIDDYNTAYVESVEPSRTGKTIRVVTVEFGRYNERRYGARTMVTIDDYTSVTVIGFRKDAHDAVCITDEDVYRNTFDCYVELMEDGEFDRVLAERTTNGGLTWEVIDERRAA